MNDFNGEITPFCENHRCKTGTIGNFFGVAAPNITKGIAMKSIYLKPKTDLASEIHEYLSKKERGKLDGLVSQKYKVGSLEAVEVEVLDERGASKVGKPCGRYVTADIGRLRDTHGEDFRTKCEALAEIIGQFIPSEGACLFAGLGNRRITSDATGPATADSFLATRHIKSEKEQIFNALSLRETMCIATDVLGNTGIEAAELLRGIADSTKPAFAVVIDSLATSSLTRLATTVQICDSGISPGSGVNNRRRAINRETLGIPVIAIGVPTVADLYAVFGGFDERSENSHTLHLLESLPDTARFVTPKDADSLIRSTSRLVAYALNLALNPALTFDEMTTLAQ